MATVRRMPVLPPDDYAKQKAVPPRIPNGTLPATQLNSPSGDPVISSRLPLQVTPSLSFEGIQQTTFKPPSPNIAAGPDDLIEVVNSSIARYTKSGELTNQTNLPQWFAGTIFQTVCASNNNCIFGDVNIRYDQIHGRFILVLQARDINSVTSYLPISVSNGATYASGWTNWAVNERLDGTTVTTNWADFPQVGFDNVAVYVTTNQFSFGPDTFQYGKVRIFSKTDLYNPATVTLPYRDFYNLKNADNTPASGLQVPQLRGRTQTATSNAAVMINASDVINASYYTLWRIQNPTSASPTITRSTLSNVWPYTYPAAAPQLGSGVTLDTGPSSFGPTFMREGLLYGAHNAGHADEPTTVSYTVVDVAQSKVTLQQRWVNGSFFYPSFDVPASIGPGNTLPNNLVVGTTTSPTGALTYASITNVKAGEDFYASAGATDRWGDFFGAAVDPTGGGLWVSGEYAKTRANFAERWGTWNAYFPWNTSPEFTDVPSSSFAFHQINLMKLWSVSKGCAASPPTYCPSDALTRSALAIFVINAVYGDNFTYPATPYFTDVAPTDYFFPYVQKMREQGFTQGCSTEPAKFCPNDTVTRYQAAVFVTQAKLKGLFGNTFTYPTTPYFTDVPNTHPAFASIQKFRELGLTKGCSATPAMFCPDAPLTREQAAVFIINAFFN